MTGAPITALILNLVQGFNGETPPRHAEEYHRWLVNR